MSRLKFLDGSTSFGQERELSPNYSQRPTSRGRSPGGDHYRPLSPQYATTTGRPPGGGGRKGPGDPRRHTVALESRGDGGGVAILTPGSPMSPKYGHEPIFFSYYCHKELHLT